MDDANFTVYKPIRRQIDLMPAQLQWCEAAALASHASRSDNVRLQQEYVRLAKSAIARIGALVEAAARANAG